MSGEAPGAPGAGRLPDFFVVGLPKAGTTALYEMLRRHPQVFMPALKEPRFFDRDLRPLFEPASTGRLPDTLEQYIALFAPAAPDQRLGEASPSYLRSTVAAREIAALRPDARIIAILREPASLVRSLQLQLLQEHVESEQDLRRAFAAEEIERAGRRVRRYSDHIDYVAQLRRYHEAFGQEQVLVLIYDDFRADNRATLRRVLAFIGVDEEVEIEPVAANPTVNVRSPRLDAAVRALYAGRGPIARPVKAAANALTAGRLRGEGAHTLRRRLMYGAPPPTDEEFMRELRVRFVPEVRAVSDYLGRDLVSLWGYDQLD